VSRRTRGYLFTLGGMSLSVIGYVAFRGKFYVRFDGALGLLAIVAPFLVMMGGGIIAYYGRQLSANTAQEVLEKDRRPPILYLRSFQDDKNNTLVNGITAGFSIMSGAAGGGRYEECLANIFESYGPFVAVGRPGETLPTLGAAREYVSHAGWQQEVSRLMDMAALVVVHLGRTEGVWWELKTALRALKSRRLIVEMPPYGLIGRLKRRDAYAKLSVVIKELLGKPLPPDQTDSRYVYFDELGGMQFLVRRWAPNPVKALRRTLGPVLEVLDPVVYAKEERKPFYFRPAFVAIVSAILIGLTIGFLESSP
jgi:hypothetical protein